MRSFAVIGGLGRDIYIHLKSFQDLPRIFMEHVGESIEYSEIPQRIGPDWTAERLLKLLHVTRRLSSYGGRAAHIASQVSLLGGNVNLVTEAGEDFDRQYKGFFDGGYFTRLRKLHVRMKPLLVNLPDKTLRNPKKKEFYLARKYCPEIAEKGFLIVAGKSIPTILCLTSETEEDNIFFLDDENAANMVQYFRPPPISAIESCEGVFLTTCESTDYMCSIIETASKLNKEILMDIGSRVEYSFLRKSVPKVDILFGNLGELERACRAFNINTKIEKPTDVAKLLNVLGSEKKPMIIVEKKENCSATIIQDTGECTEVGPIAIPGRLCNIGCCDGMAAGFLALHQRNMPIELCAKAGLIIGASIWGVEGVQEGLLGTDEFIKRFLKEFPTDQSLIQKWRLLA